VPWHTRHPHMGSSATFLPSRSRGAADRTEGALEPSPGPGKPGNTPPRILEILISMRSCKQIIGCAGFRLPQRCSCAAFVLVALLVAQQGAPARALPSGNRAALQRLNTLYTNALSRHPLLTNVAQGAGISGVSALNADVCTLGADARVPAAPSRAPQI